MATALEIRRAQRAMVGEPGDDGPGPLGERYARVLRTLDREHVPWALVGAHAVNLFTRPRATEDLDLVVRNRDVTQIVRSLGLEFGGEIATVDIGPAVRLDLLKVDLIRSGTHPLFHIALTRAASRSGVSVPPCEVLVALKFLAAISPWRDPADRKQDAADLIRLVEVVGVELNSKDVIDLAALAYPGAGREMEALLDRIERGESVEL